MSALKTVYAFLVGINNYPNPSHRLEGCIRDIEDLQVYLESYCKNHKLELKVLKLQNEKATREAIVEGFRHFDQAKDADICLFMYSGHGSRCPVPPEFQHLESDGYLETIVCYDSRQEDGRDLADKELSWLIWKATKDKEDLHFLVIMDCCHSGRITRTMFDSVGNGFPKEVKASKNWRGAREYLGFEDYTSEKNNRYTPPLGRYVLLAASRDNQTAKEVYVNKKRRGIFTYCFLEALKKARGQISYTDLINRVNLRIRNVVSEQSPQIISPTPADKNYYFLSTRNKALGRKFFAAWDEKKEEWQVNAGMMQGIMPPAGETATTFVLEDNKAKIKIAKVFANYTVIEGMEGYNRKTVHQVRMPNLVNAKFLIGIAKNSEIKGVVLLKEALQSGITLHFQWTDDPQKAHYLIHAQNNAWFLTTPDLPANTEALIPLFPKVSGYTKERAIYFLNDLETFYQWVVRLELRHLDTRIREDEFELQLYRINESGNSQDPNHIELVDSKQPVDFYYINQNGIWNEPRFSFRILNKGFRKLWVSLSYFGADFSINNHLLDIQELNPGEETWAFTVDGDGYRYLAIPLWISDADHNSSRFKIEEFIKIFICTEEFSTDDFNQKGVPSRGSLRDVGLPAAIRRPDWTTREILIRIERPRNARVVRDLT